MNLRAGACPDWAGVVASGTMSTIRSMTAGTVRGVVWLGTGLMMAGVSLAQQAPAPAGGAPQPPTPSRPDEPPAIMTVLVLAVIGGLVLFASLLPSKRGHQD